MRQPPGTAAPGEDHLVCRLKKSLYGLKQAPCDWNKKMDLYLKELSFHAYLKTTAYIFFKIRIEFVFSFSILMI